MIEELDARAVDLDPQEMLRYGRHLVLPEVGIGGQQRLKAARVLLVGAGGLGSPLALYLAAAGVGRLGLVEFDRVEESNLQRQILYGASDVGRSKLEAAVERLRDINPHIEIVPHDTRLSKDDALELFAGYDVVADGSDNFPTRYLVNDACVLLGKPNVWGSIFRFEGQVSVFWSRRGPCYRCLFPEPPPVGLVPSCAEGGVLGVLPGIIGALQANEVVKLVTGLGTPLLGRFVVFDALGMRFRELALKKSPTCPICSEQPTLTELVQYDDSCLPETAEAEIEPLECSVQELDSWRQGGRELNLIDVREPSEWAIGRIEGSRLVPLRELPDRLDELDPAQDLVVLCHVGVRSLHAVRFLRREGFLRATSLAGGIDAWSREIDPSVRRY